MYQMPREPPSRSAQEADLVRLAQRGDRAAFDRLARRYRGILLAAAYARTRDRDEAEDLVQDVLAKTWDKLPTLRDPAAFPAWLNSTMINACRNWRRRRPWPAQLAEAHLPDNRRDRQPAPLEHFLAYEQRQVWGQALRAIPEQNRLPFVLHILGRYTCEEIAALLGLPLTTIEGRVHRARLQLRRLVGEDVLETWNQRHPPLREKEQSHGTEPE
jgi:RNA polymerase sigma-70 factor (ECF subfamily)